MHIYPIRASLEGLEIEIFKLVSYSATPEQWKEWLRVPLEHAAARGNLGLFNKLLETGADGSAGWRGCRNRTLLDAVAVGGNEGVVSGLLRVGAQPDVKVVSCSSKRSALYTATVLGHEGVARRLVVAGADVNFEDPFDKRTVLAEATRNGQEQLVTALLLSGASPNCRNSNGGASPLHIAALNGFDGIVSTLLLRGAAKEALDDDGETPLMWACDGGHLSVVTTLLVAGVNASLQDTDGYSALDYAAEEGYGDIVEAIVGHGTDVNARDDGGFTALHAAAIQNQAGAVDALIKAGADVELKRSDGSTPFASAAYNSSCKSMFALLQHGAKDDVRDNDGDTPLHEACFGRNTGLAAAVDLLLRWGADETALNDAGQSPVELLDVENDEDDADNPATQDEIDRTRLLLARAPADRAWRRRGWLVMLCSRGSKAKTDICNRDDGEGGGSELARSETIMVVECDGPRKTSTGAGGEAEAEGGERVIGCEAGLLGLELGGTMLAASNECVVGAEGGEESSLRLEVLPLLGLGLEGVFRTVVGYL